MKRYLSRRTLLRGMAGGATVTVGLPLLGAMLNNNGTALAGGGALPTRFLTWFFGNGVILDRFEPEVTGPDWQVSEQLAPLADVKDYVSVLTGFANRCEVLLSHHEGMTAFNGHTMAEVVEDTLFSKAGGPTIDQLIADTLEGQTSTRSVQVGVSKRPSVMDSGTTLYALSHRGPNDPLYPETSPQEVWRQLFYEFTPRPDDSELRFSILDAVREDARSLRASLGTEDRSRLEAHLDGVRALENKIAAAPPSCTIPDEPTVQNVDQMGREPLRSVHDAMIDLLVYAFTCDVTRVGSVFFTGGASETVFAEGLGQITAHHDNTHYSDRQVLVNDAVIWMMERFGELLRRFESEVDVDGNNLLDTSIIYASSDCAEGFSHSVERQPVIIAGRGRGALTHPGVHVQATPKGAAGNISDALLTCLQVFDPTATEIGSGAPMSTTPLTDILA